MWANHSTDQKYFTGHLFSIKLEENSYKMSFKALPVKIQHLKNRQGGGTMCPEQLRVKFNIEKKEFRYTRV